MMSIERSEIIAHIRTYLNNHKGINFPKIGKLTVIKQPARINSFNQRVLPPCEELHFAYNPQITTGGFPSFLASQTLISEDSAHKIFDDFANEIISSLTGIDSFVVKGIGIFSRKNGIIRFLPDEMAMQRSSYGLPEIKITPISKVSEVIHSENIITVAPSSTPVKPRISWLRTVWDVIATAAIFILLLIAFQSPDFKGLLLSELETPSEDKGQEVLKIEELKRYNQKPEKRLINGSIQEDYESLIPGNVKTAAPVASCALILGSFTKERNAVKMQQLILATEYELYTEEFHEFFRVGISVPCDKVNGSLFREVENITGVDPWLRIYID